MKKTLSVFLACLMIFSCMVPALAAEGTHTLTFRSPSPAYEGGYMFVKSENGKILFVEDPDGKFVFYDNRYMTIDNILPEYRDEVGPERYSPVQQETVSQVETGKIVTFRVMTSEKYNVKTAAVFINDVRAYPNERDEYSFVMDRDTTIRISERDENGNEVLLRNHYNVKLTSGNGFRAETRKGENYNVVYHGDSFRFRVRIFKGYNANGIKVTVARTQYKLDNMGDVSEIIGSISGEKEELRSLGVDEDNCRIYEINNITTDCAISVSGVVEDDKVGIFAMLKRILRLILNLFGIDSDFLGSVTNYYNVEVKNEVPGISYEILRTNADPDETAPTKFQVTSGEGVTMIIEKKSYEQPVNVLWTPGNETGSYITEWKIKYDPLTAETTYVAIYNIDAIKADTVISIYQ